MKQFQESIDAYLSGELPPEELQMFEQKLLKSKKLRELLTVQKSIHLAIQNLYDESSKHRGIDAVLADLQAKKDRPLKKSVLSELIEEKKRKARRKSIPIWTGLAACAGFLIMFWFSRPQQPIVQEDEIPLPLVTHKASSIPQRTFVARITHEENVIWNDQSSIEKNDQWLSSGKIKIEKGTLLITHASGTKVRLHGPADYDLTNSNRGFLNSGRARARVPKQATGFTINTPDGTVIDLGTEFILDVRANKRTEVHVIEGMVKAVTAFKHSSEQERLVKEKQAVAFSAIRSELLPIVYNDDGLDFNEENHELHMGHYMHYNFDEIGSGMFYDSGNNPKPFHAKLLQNIDNDLPLTPQPTNVPGRYGYALRFNGDQTFLQTDFTGFQPDQARTFSFWVKIPPEAEMKTSMSILSWRLPIKRGFLVIGWNENPKRGKLGAISTRFGSGQLTGTTYIRDGHWHHIAIVYVGGINPDISTHMKQYVDGSLEGTSYLEEFDMSNAKVKINKNFSENMTIGLKPNIDKHKKAPRYFHGELDEFYIFERAIDPSQIMNLIRYNELIYRPDKQSL